MIRIGYPEVAKEMSKINIETLKDLLGMEADDAVGGTFRG